MPDVDIVDISKWQYTPTPPDFDVTPGVGMIHRATDWQTGNQLEVQFPAAWTKMRRFRYRGAYQRLRADLDIDVQADRFLAAVGPLRQGEFVELDVETTAGVTPTVAQCVAWLERVEAVCGVGRVGVYVGWYAVDANGVPFRTSPVVGWPWRLPWYNLATYPPPVTPLWWAHQWTDAATVPGITRPCDANELLDVATAERLAGYGGVMPVVHEREEWLEGYQVAAGEGSAWWGGHTFPPSADITNITWHYPGGNVDQDGWDDIFQPDDAGAVIRRMQADYHRRRDGGGSGKPPPFDRGYDLGYNAVIDLDGGIWKVRWTDKRCAANGGTGNAVSFAVQFMVAGLNDDLTPEMVASARWLDRELRGRFPNMLDGVDGHTPHSRWFPTACCGDTIRSRLYAGDLLWQDNPQPPPTPPPPPPPPPPIVLEGLFVSVYRIAFGAPQIIADGTIFELVAGTKRHVNSTEWTRVVKGVAAGPDGKVPAHDPWTPVAMLADPWGLNVMPNYTPPAPPSGTGLTQPQVTDACKVALQQTSFEATLAANVG